MRFTLTVVLAALMIGVAVPAFAELQNVEVGGSIRIRGNFYSSDLQAPVFDERGNSLSFVEQRTTISVKADFTDDVSAFIELDSYDIWGEDFRSFYVTGADMRAGHATGDVEVYQAYIETRETFGYPLTIKIGRQEFTMGSEWLIGNNDTGSLFRGLSFDAITAVYEADVWAIQGGWGKLAETSPMEEDGDTDIYGLGVTYSGLEDIVLEAYWIYLRDGFEYGRSTSVVGGNSRLFEAIEDVIGVDQYDTTNIHTIGLRGTGNIASFDFEVELAYQWGDANAAVKLFQNPDPASLLPIAWGEDDAEYDAIALNAEVGYTFDISMQPRVYLGAAYFEGEDNRDDSQGEWAASFAGLFGLNFLTPWAQNDASISFNRLFSDWEYGEIMSTTALSNSLFIRGGVSLQPTESIEVSGHLIWHQADDPSTLNFRGLRLAPIFIFVPFGPPFNIKSDDDMGLELDLYLTYDYSEDLTFEVGYAHYFTDDGSQDGNFVGANGLGLVGGAFGLSSPANDDDDIDYVYVETRIAF